MEALSLQTQCLTCILHHLQDYPSGLLCQIPTRQRRELLMSLPPLDICKLEASEVVSGIDLNEVWHVTCCLYDETDNVRITGNRKFDCRYLDYRHDDDDDDMESIKTVGRPHTNKYKAIDIADVKVKGDWKAHFLTRTVQILLHSFNPLSLPEAVLHSNGCNSMNDFESECDCWGEGLDPDHRVVLQRLMTIPPQSHISKVYGNLRHRSSHFKDIVDAGHHGQMLVPFRYAQCFTESFEISFVELLSMLVRTCQFRPKLLPVRCEFMFHTELYRMYLQNREKWNREVFDLFADFLSEVECLEFYWVGGLRDKDTTIIDGGISSPTTYMPRMFIESALANPTPKLDTLHLSMYRAVIGSLYYLPRIDACLSSIAPLLSNFCSSDAKDRFLKLNMPYNGLKRIHILGVFEKELSDEILSSILLHQKAIEGLKMSCIAQKSSRLDETLDAITGISTLSHLQYLIFNTWQAPGDSNNALRRIFEQFLDANPDCEIGVSALGHNVTIVPADSHISCKKLLRLYTTHLNDSFMIGRLFEWLQERRVRQFVRVVRLETKLDISMKKFLIPYLSQCEELEFDYKVNTIFSTEFFQGIAANSHLRVLQLNNINVSIDDFCKALESLYKYSKNIEVLSYRANKLNKLPGEKLEYFFKILFSYSHLEQLAIDLRGNNLKASDLDTMCKVWSDTAGGSLLKSITVDKAHQDSQVLRTMVNI